jgi:CPA2 family monovalent cation:H+ antiporter-2
LIAGLMLSTGDFRRQIEAAVQPFEGLLLGVFLIWVGSGLDLGALAADPWPVLGGAAMIITLKAAAIFGLLRLRKVRGGVAGHVALLLASPSETGLIVLGAAVSARLIGGPDAQMVLAIASLSLALAPLLGLAGARLERQANTGRSEPIPADTSDGQRTVSIGYGRVGVSVAAAFQALNARVTLAARNPVQLARAEASGLDTVHTDRLAEVIGQFDLVVSSPTAKVVTRDVLAAAKPGALVIDLRSPPGSVDHDAAKDLGTKVVWARAQAGTAPRTAGRNEWRVLMRIWGEINA